MIEDFFSWIIILQVAGTIFSVVQVLLAKNNNINNYLFGIVSSAIALWIHYSTLLYADILLDCYYLIMSAYGWFYWKYGTQKHPTPISFSRVADYVKTSGIIILAFVSLQYWLRHHTNSDVPIWDAIVVAFACGGMWLMAKRKIENWIFLNISNFISVPLLIYKELYIYAALTVFLFVIAVLGYKNWKKIATKASTNSVELDDL